MTKRITYVLAIGLLIGMGFLSFAAPRVQAATLDPKGQACEALGLASNSSGDCSNPAGPNVDNTLKLAINLFSFLVGVAALVMIIVGGFKYITSQGESSNTASAKNTILYAIVGLVVVALAQIIVLFVLKKANAPVPPKCRTGQKSTVQVPCST